jgi:hypothetical protein
MIQSLSSLSFISYNIDINFSIFLFRDSIRCELFNLRTKNIFFHPLFQKMLIFFYNHQGKPTQTPEFKQDFDQKLKICYFLY